MELKVNFGTFLFGMVGILVGYLIAILVVPGDYEKITYITGTGMFMGAGIGTYVWAPPFDPKNKGDQSD